MIETIHTKFYLKNFVCWILFVENLKEQENATRPGSRMSRFCSIGKLNRR